MKWRTSAGSRIVGGKAARSVAGPQKRRNTRKRSCRRHSVDGRRSGPGKPQSLTRRRWQRSWLLAKPGFPGGAGRDRERQRSIVSSARGREHRGGEAPPSGGCPVLPSNKEGGRRGDGAEAGVTRRQARAQPGLDRRKTVWRRSRALVSATSVAVEDAGSGQRCASCALGSRAICECSGRESVAEVGEKHLPRPFEGSREASRERVR